MTITRPSRTIDDLVNLISESLHLIADMPDWEAALCLNQRMKAWDWIDVSRERSYAERGLIACQFESRKLWGYIDDPRTGKVFSSFNAWAACRDNGARSTTFEAKRDVEALKDVPADVLRQVPKANIKVLKQLSTAVRREPAVLEAAKNMPTAGFQAMLEVTHPSQHIQAPVKLTFKPERDGAAKVEECIAWALEHGIAGSRDEAIVKAAEQALGDWQLERDIEEIANRE